MFSLPKLTQSKSSCRENSTFESTDFQMGFDDLKQQKKIFLGKIGLMHGISLKIKII